jgi:pyruvate kinase
MPGGRAGERVLGVTRAKIVATLGPASASPQAIRQFIDAGLDVARLNVSHGSHTDHEAAYAEVRRASEDTSRSVGVLVDAAGAQDPSRTSRGRARHLTAGDGLVITTDDVPGDRHIVSTTYAGLSNDVHPGDRVLIDDGRLTLVVTAAAREVTTRVLVGGHLSDHKGLNVPDATNA